MNKLGIRPGKRGDIIQGIDRLPSQRKGRRADDNFREESD